MSIQDFLKDIVPELVVVIIGGAITTFILDNTNLDIRRKIAILTVIILVLLAVLFWKKLKNLFHKLKGEIRIKQLEDAIKNQVIILKRIEPTLRQSIENLTRKLDNKDEDIASIREVLEDLNKLKSEANNLLTGISLLDSLEDERQQTIKRDQERRRRRVNNEEPKQ